MSTATLQSALEAQRALVPPGRREALELLLRDGFPDRRTEHWKYTRTRALEAFAAQALMREIPTGSGDVRDRLAHYFADGLPAHVVVVSNGRTLEALTSLPAALSITDIDHAAGATRTAVHADGPEAALLRLNTALPTLHKRIDIAAGETIDAPLHIVHLADADGTLAQPRWLLHAGAGSRATIVEHFIAGATARAMHNSVATIQLDADAALSHTRIQALADDALQVTRIDAELAHGARLRTFTLDVGGALVRNDLNVALAGEHAEVDMRGVYLGDGSQHIDNHTRVDHIARDTVSNEDYRGILRDRSHCVFNGKVMVHRGADGTDASQSNPNLLLSDDAEIDTKPELEIYADDVKCAHGATVGQLDEQSLFYLRSRGIDEATATQLLTWAFCRATFAGIDDRALRRHLERLVADQIPEFTALESLV